jgi:PAS domain S-box-containing protein
MIRNRYFFASLILFLLLKSFSSVDAQPQNIRFEHLTTDEGLSHSNVLCVLQDHFGYLWFGTFDGLSKYDGYEFICYRYSDKDPNTIPNNIIRSLYEDRDGNLWIGTDGGLCLYNRDLDKYIRCNKENGYPLDITNIILSITQDNENKLWLGTNGTGAFEFDRGSNQCIQYSHHEDDPSSISSNFISRIFEDSKGNMWFAAFGLDLFNHKTKVFTHYRHNENDPHSLIGNGVLSIVEDIKDNLWVGCYNAGLSHINLNELNKNIFINYQHNPQKDQSLSQNLIMSLCSDRNGGLWIGTENDGLDFLQNDKKTFIHYKNDKSDPNSLNSNSIYSLCQDKTGDLWIGTFNGGVNVIHCTRQAFKHYKNKPGNPNSLSHNSVWGFDEDREGNIWIATDGGGLNKFDPKNGNFEYYNSRNTNLNKDAVLTVFVDAEDNIWIGKWDGGVSLLNKQTKSFFTYTKENSSLSNNNVMDIIEDRRGNLWFATTGNANGGGLNKFDKKSRSFAVFTQESSGLVYNAIEVIKEDSKGDILVGTYQGFSIFDPETEKSINYVHNPQNENSLSNNLITSIFEEDSVTIWITTVNGLNRLNRITNTITRYNKADGLPSSFIFGVEKDDKGFLWISTNGGLSRFNPKTKIFKNYTKEDGLQGNTFIKKSHYRSRDGKLYFGGINGFNVFNPNQVTDNTYIPPVVITDFKIFNKHVMIGDKGLGNEIGMTEGLVLSYTQSVFSFDFAALNYISSTKNEYAYKMEGFEKDWNYVGTKHTATYTNLDPGKYIFRVKGSNNDGVWNEEGVSLPILITPPFWQTLWFRLILLAISMGIIYWVYKWRKQLIELAIRRRIDVALTKERNLLRTMIDNIPDGIYVKDKESRKLLVNLADLHHLGYKSEAEVLGKNDFDIYPKELAEGFYADDQKVIQTGQPVIDREEYVIDEQGQKLWLLTTKVPLRDEEGQTIGLVGVGRNITERKKAEAEREKLITQLQDALADVKLLSGLVPICANCKKIRDDQGYWTQIESYIQDRSDAKFSHSICPDCAKKLYPNYNIKK